MNWKHTEEFAHDLIIMTKGTYRNPNLHFFMLLKIYSSWQCDQWCKPHPIFETV